MSEILAFSAEQVCRLTGLTVRQLSEWDKSGFFAPQYADEVRRRPYSRVYSFRDVVGLRTIAKLRREYGIPVQELKKVAKWLEDRYTAPWATLKFWVWGKKVAFEDPLTGARVVSRPMGQLVMPILMDEIAQEVESATIRLRQRSSEMLGKVSKHRYVAHNQPVLAGTRIPTSAVWSFHEAGYDTEAIIREYPTLTPADVFAAISFEEERRGQKRAV